METFTVAFFYSCPVPEKEKLVMQLDRYDTQIKFIPLVGTVDECCEYVKANGYYSVFVIYDGEKFKRKGCVKIYRTKTGIVVFLDQCSWVLTSDITVCRLLEDYYSEYLDYPSDGVPRVIRN